MKTLRAAGSLMRILSPAMLLAAVTAVFNGDNVVNFGDASVMFSFFFGPPGPSGVPNLCP